MSFCKAIIIVKKSSQFFFKNPLSRHQDIANFSLTYELGWSTGYGDSSCVFLCVHFVAPFVHYKLPTSIIIYSKETTQVSFSTGIVIRI